VDTKLAISKILLLNNESAGALEVLLKKGGIQDFVDFGSRLQKQTKNFHKELSPNLTIKSWDEFGRYEPLDLKRFGIKSLYWFAAICAGDPELILLHERIRNNVEHCHLRGEFEETHKLLDQHEARFGKSLWAYQWRITSYSATASEVQLSRYQQAVVDQAQGTLAVPIISLQSYLTRSDTPPRILRRSLRRSLELLDSEPLVDLFNLLLLDELPGEVNEIRLNALLKQLDQLPLVDRYSAFMRLATHLLISEQVLEQSITRALQILSTCGNDARIVLEKYHCGRVKSMLDNQYFESIEIWDSYFLGKYDDVIANLKNYQKDAPYDFNLLDLRVKSHIYLNKDFDTNVTPERWLSDALSKILKDNDIGDRIYDELDRFSLRSGFFSLGSQIRAFIRSYSGLGSSEELLKLASLRGYHFSPRYSESSPSVKPWREHIKLLITKKPHSSSVLFLHELLAEGNLESFVSLGANSGIPTIRQKYFKGLIALKLGFLPTALECITSFIDETKKDPIHGSVKFALDQAQILRADIFRLMGDSESAQEVLVDLQIDGASALKRLNLSQFYRASYTNRRATSKSIDFPLLAWLAKVGPHEICLAIKRFLKCWNVELPSQLLLLGPEINDERLREFIFRVCTAENLDSISALDTNDKVDSERLLLLRWVSKNYAGYAKQVEREKLNLIQVAQLRAGLDRIDDNKLVLDLASLQDVEGQQIEEIFQDYSSRKELAFAAFAEKIQKVFNEVSAEGGGKTIVVTQDALLGSYQDAYLTAFDRLRKIFIRSPQFGLEGCLSGRIRHGIAVEHLLKPLKSQSLLVADRSLNQVKGSNRLDLGSVTNLTPEQQELAFTALEKLTNCVADEARNFRDNVIQTCVEKGSSEAAFNYYFEDNRLVDSNYFDDSASVDWKSFSFDVFSMLAERTRECLPRLRKRISTELKVSLLGCFDDCLSDLQAIGGLQLLRTRILNAKQEMEDACEDMLRWFQDLTGAIGQDVELSFVANTAVGMLERLHPEFQSLYSKDVTSKIRLKGRYFTSFVHIIFFLVENGVKHTDLDPIEFHGDVALSSEDGDIVLKVFSSMETQETAEVAVDKINMMIRKINLDNDPDSVIKEKNSGFAKILATLRYEFKSDVSELEAFKEGSRVCVKMKTRLSGISE
jgi:hypothetical protein